MKQMAGLYTFREITDEEGLMEAFRLRYQTYKNHPQLSILIEVKKEGVEIDGFDPFARHYGIFKREIPNQKAKMIGYIRVIWHQEPATMFNQVKRITESLGIIFPEKPERLYIQKNFPESHHVKRIPIKDTSISICEPGRFILLPEYRSAGLAQFAVECTMTVICDLSSKALGIIDCGRHHRTFYERNGFTWLSEEDAPISPSNPLNLLMISAAGVAKQLPDLPERIRRYREQGCLQHRLGHIDWVAAAYIPMMMRRWKRKTKRKLKVFGQKLGLGPQSGRQIADRKYIA